MKNKSLILLVAPLLLSSCGEKAAYRKAYNTVSKFLKENGCWRTTKTYQVSKSEIIGYKMDYDASDSFYYEYIGSESKEHVEILFEPYLPTNNHFMFWFTAYDGTKEIDSYGYITTGFGVRSTVEYMKFIWFKTGDNTYYDDSISCPFGIESYKVKALYNLKNVLQYSDKFFESIGTDLQKFGFVNY